MSAIRPVRPASLLSALAIAVLAAPLAFASEPAGSKGTEKAVQKEAEASASEGGLTEAELTRMFKKFRKQERDGNTVFCRNEKPLGTRIGKQVCYSEEQVVAMARAERDARNQMSQMNVCGSGSCSPGG